MELEYTENQMFEFGEYIKRFPNKSVVDSFNDWLKEIEILKKLKYNMLSEIKEDTISSLIEDNVITKG